MSDTQYLAPVWTHLTDMQPVRGEGVYLYDAAGTRYTDFTSGIGVVNTGHAHPAIVAAMQAQAPKLLFGQMNCVITPAAAALAAALNGVTPPHIDRFFFSNSGAEAVEGAVKLARQATGKPNIVVFQGSYHGRTAQTMAMTTSKFVYRHHMGPLPSGIFTTPFPNHHYYNWSEEQTSAWCLEQLDLLLHGQTAPDETAAIIIEPVQGEGGYVPAPPAFLRALQDVCRQHDILLIVDEVQSGFGRTGTLFAFEQANIEPDIIIMAKGLGSGMPISCVASTQKLMAKWLPGTHGGTYGGGNTLCMVAAKATIDVMRDEKLPENAAARGEQFRAGLTALQKRFAGISDVRGLGLMIGIEFRDPKTRKPDAALCSAVANGCKEHNLLLLSCGSYKNVLRVIPPLVVTAEQVDEALGIIGTVLEKVTQPVDSTEEEAEQKSA